MTLLIQTFSDIKGAYSVLLCIIEELTLVGQTKICSSKTHRNAV